MRVAALVVPVRRKDVSQDLDGDKLTLNRELVVLECDADQAVAWALIQDRSTERQLCCQLQTVTGRDADWAEKTISASLDLFLQLGLIEIEQLPRPAWSMDCTKYSHFMTTRGGLYMFNRESIERLDYGMFFGLHASLERGLIVYDFPHKESSLFRRSFSDAKKTPSQEGRLQTYPVVKNAIGAPQTLVTGLGNNCHHLVAHNNELVVVDTDHQRILQIDDKLTLSPSSVLDQHRDYHINSAVRWRDKWLLLKSVNCASSSGSGFAIFDDLWRLEQEIDLPAQRAHDFWLGGGDELSFWYCNSAFNELKHYPSALTIEVPRHRQGNNTIRGLAQDDECWVVASGTFGRYDFNRINADSLGALCFVDRDTHELVAKLDAPETACCIVANPWFNR